MVSTSMPYNRLHLRQVDRLLHLHHRSAWFQKSSRWRQMPQHNQIHLQYATYFAFTASATVRPDDGWRHACNRSLGFALMSNLEHACQIPRASSAPKVDPGGPGGRQHGVKGSTKGETSTLGNAVSSGTPGVDACARSSTASRCLRPSRPCAAAVLPFRGFPGFS